MRQVIESCAEPGDGVCLAGHIHSTDSSEYTTLMTNTERTLDQLTTTAGGVVMTGDGKICTECINEMPKIVFKNPKTERLALD